MENLAVCGFRANASKGALLPRDGAEFRRV